MISFSLAEGSPGKLAVQLQADLLGGNRSPRKLRLLARRGDRITAHRPIFSHTERVAGPRFIRRRQVMRWDICFELPTLVGKDPRTSFQLVCEPHPAVDLPELGWAVKPPIYERRAPRAGALLAASGALLAGLGPGLALAEGGSTAPSTPPAGTTTAAQTVPAPVASTPTEPAQTTSDPAPTTTATPPPTTTSTPAPPAAATTTSTAPVTTTSTALTTTTTATTTTPTTTTATTTTATTPTTTATTTTATVTTPATTTPAGGSDQQTTGTAVRRHRKSNQPAASSHPSTATNSTPSPTYQSAPATAPATDSDDDGDDDSTSVANPVATTGTEWTVPSLSAPFTSAQLRGYDTLLGGMAQPPKYLVKIYQAAAAHYHIPWQVLAAINYVETHYGQDVAVSSAGAVGWMQFMPSTWAEYGQAVNLQGQPLARAANPSNPTDAIFAAARYLAAAGAQRNLPEAIYAYNHAGWYVQEVLSIAEQIASNSLPAGAKAGRKIEAMRTMARLLNGLPYVWGGGHSAFAQVSGGYDCSGFVSAVLHAAGYLQTPQTTQTLPGQSGVRSGPGRFVTILDRTDAGISDDHVIIDIDGQWWESGGWGVQSDRVHRMRDVTAAYLQSFNLVLHPQGL